MATVALALALDAVPLPLAGAVLVPDAGVALSLVESPWTTPRPPPRPPLVLFASPPPQELWLVLRRV